MKIVVAVKRVPDAYARIHIKKDNTGVETQNVKMGLNPFDEIAIEEAVRCKERGQAQEVVVVSIGTAPCQETLRTALALGADRAVLIETDELLAPLAIAKILASFVKTELPQVVMLGKQSIDGDNNQTGQMLAGLLGWAQGTFISQLNFLDTNSIEVGREVDGGLETLKLKLPAVITTDLRLNQPRYASLPGIMKAKTKSLLVIPLAEFGLSLPASIEVIKVTAPSKRKVDCQKVNVKELVDKLVNEAKVIAKGE